MSDVCWSCSSPLSKRFCRSCGADSGCPSCGEIALGRFCRSCGFDVSAKRGIPLASADPTGPTVVAAAIPIGSLGPSLDQTAADETSEQLDKPSPTRSRRKILVAAAAILVVGLIASAIALRSQGSDQAVGSDIQEELVVASTVPTTQPPTTLVAAEPPTTLPPTPTTRAAPAPQAPQPPPTAPVATVDPAIAVPAACASARDRYVAKMLAEGRIINVTADAPQQTNANPLTWLVVFRYDVGAGPQRTDATIVCQPNGTVQTSTVHG